MDNHYGSIPFANSSLGTYSCTEWRNDVGTPQSRRRTMGHNCLQEKDQNGEEFGLLCHFFGTRGYDISTSLLIDSEEEQIVLLANPALVRGTCSGKAYLKQYDATNPTKLPVSLFIDPTPPLSSPKLPLNKCKPKEVSFDKSLQKRVVEVLAALLSLISWHSWQVF